ncbi:MAG: rhodanese-like domain-containing protein [Sinimarinibacterium sp.]|jgi:rhodanese-related sulfurtransferase
MRNIDVHELQRCLRQPGVTVLDVRTDEELFAARLAGAKHIPLQELPMRYVELNPAQHIAVLCHHGVRSQMAARFLEQNGFQDVSSVDGGLDAWSMHVDPTVPRY